MHILYTLPVKGLGTIFLTFFEKSLMLAKATIILAKYSKNSKIVKCYYNLKYLFSFLIIFKINYYIELKYQIIAKSYYADLVLTVINLNIINVVTVTFIEFNAFMFNA